MWRRSRRFVVLVVAAVAVVLSAPAPASAAPPAVDIPIPNPCDIPVAGHICDIPGDIAGAAGDAVMHGVTVWVTNGAVWVTTKVGELIDATASPDVQAPWFEHQYGAMLTVAGMLAVPMLLLAVIQAVVRQDAGMLARSALGYLPLAFILAAAAIVATQLLIAVTDDLSRSLVQGLGGRSDNLLKSVGDTFSHAIKDDHNDGVPLVGIFLGALVLMVGSLVLWIELVIRDATIYIALFFLPLTFVAMIWPATSRYCRRLVEFLVAVVLAKLVVVAIVGLAAAALTNAGTIGSAAAGAAATTGGGDGQVFERMVAGAALLVLAAYSPFALLRAIPLIEGAAASVSQSRQSIGGAASAAGVSPADHLRQAMHSAPASYPAQSGPVRMASRGEDAGAGGGTPNAARAWQRPTGGRESHVAPSAANGASTSGPAGGRTDGSPAPSAASASSSGAASPSGGAAAEPSAPSPTATVTGGDHDTTRSAPQSPPQHARPPRPTDAAPAGRPHGDPAPSPPPHQPAPPPSPSAPQRTAPQSRPPQPPPPPVPPQRDPSKEV